MLIEKFQTRPAGWADVSIIVDLRNVSSQSTLGRDVSAVHWQKRGWYDSGINLDNDSILILEGEIAIGYAELSSESPYIVYEMTGAVHPKYRGCGIGTQLLHWAEKRVQQSIEEAPEGAAIFIQNSIFDSNQPGQDLLKAQGFEIVRDFVHLKIDMNNKPPDPYWPEDIEVRLLKSGDWEKVGPALYEAFDDHWGNVEYDAGETEENDEPDRPDPEKSDPEAFDAAFFNSPGLCFVAWDGEEVAGSCLCNATTVEFPDAGYIGSLSIRRTWRQRGIGRALTLHALNAFYERGSRRVFTDTDGDSLTKAYRVYQKSGMEIYRREYVFEKTIRPGRDYVKRRPTE